MKPETRARLQNAAPVMTLVLLGGLCYRTLGGSPAEGEPVARCRRLAEAVRALPPSVGPWVGGARAASSDPSPWGNGVPIHREYENLNTGQHIVVWIVQSFDRRELREYVPERWYPRQGWTLGRKESSRWAVAGRRVRSQVYELTDAAASVPREATGVSFVLRGDGRTAPSPAALTGESWRGVDCYAEVWIRFPAAMARRVRRRAIARLIGPVMRKLTGGARP